MTLLWRGVRPGPMEGKPGARKNPLTVYMRTYHPFWRLTLTLGVTHYPVSRAWGFRRVGHLGGRIALDLWAYSIVLVYFQDEPHNFSC